MDNLLASPCLVTFKHLTHEMRMILTSMGKEVYVKKTVPQRYQTFKYNFQGRTASLNQCTFNYSIKYNKHKRQFMELFIIENMTEIRNHMRKKHRKRHYQIRNKNFIILLEYLPPVQFNAQEYIRMPRSLWRYYNG